MSYNLKDKYKVAVALAFIATVAMGYSSFAQAEEAAPDTPDVVAENVDLSADTDMLEEDFFGLESEGEEKTEEENLSAETEEVQEPPLSDVQADTQEQAEEESSDQLADIFGVDQDSVGDDELFAPQKAEEATDSEFEESVAAGDVSEQEDNDDFLNLPSDTSADEGNSASADENNEIVAEAPKSPFEKFGNAILSKVDNDLFTQMSNIEKQNTILNLQLKREELKNKVEALRVARQKARYEEEVRKQMEEERLKDLEAERQAKLMNEEAKLKEKEITLEKVRQGKVLNEYMNEMLEMNQQWIDKNAQLQNRITELEKERKDLVAEFEKKLAEVVEKTLSTSKAAQKSLSAYQQSVAAFNSEIAQLRQSVIDTENRLAQSLEGNSLNPFADVTIDQNAIDMSQEYAIMDITGKGNDIVAKIVGRDGTTFIVHKGSMLKGGEVVTAISDNYIAFDNKGIKSYLYTGGTVMEYEPMKTFNGSDRTPVETQKMSIKGDIHNVRGAASSSANSPRGEEYNNTSSAMRSGSARGSSSSAIRATESSSPSATSSLSTSTTSGGYSSSDSGKTMSVSKGMFTK